MTDAPHTEPTVQGDGECGAATNDGDPCSLSPTRPDGRCHLHTATEDVDPGRPSKLTDERTEAIATMLESGHSITAAARSNDITVRTFLNWMERGEAADEGPHADFHLRVIRARGKGEAQYVDALISIAKETGDTATLMTLLRSRYPESWGDAERGEQAGGVEVVVPEVDSQ